MTRWRLKLFGYEVASLERDDDEEAPMGITGGASHNFEKDTDPLDPNQRYDWEWEDRKFGFR